MPSLLLGGGCSWAAALSDRASGPKRCRNTALARPARAACQRGGCQAAAWLCQPQSGRARRILARHERTMAARQRRRGLMALAVASPGSQGVPLGPSTPEAKKENFLTRVLKPLRDFGFGRVSFWEGGVGLFVFAGIGARLFSAASPHTCLVYISEVALPETSAFPACQDRLQCTLLLNQRALRVWSVCAAKLLRMRARRRLRAGAGQLGARGAARGAGQGLPSATARIPMHTPWHLTSFRSLPEAGVAGVLLSAKVCLLQSTDCPHTLCYSCMTLILTAARPWISHVSIQCTEAQ